MPGILFGGIESGTHRIVGTEFQPKQTKVGNEELENWLARLLHPRIHFKIYEFAFEDKPIVLLEAQGKKMYRESFLLPEIS